MATQKVNNNKTLTAALKKQAVVLNKEILEASNELVDGMVPTVEKWQNIAEKALKTGIKLFGKQQDLIISAIETAKGQLDNSSKRFNKLVGNTAKKAKKKAAPSVETDTEEVTIDSIMEDAKAPVKKAIKKVKELELAN